MSKKTSPNLRQRSQNVTSGGLADQFRFLTPHIPPCSLTRKRRNSEPPLPISKKLYSKLLIRSNSDLILKSEISNFSADKGLEEKNCSQQAKLQKLKLNQDEKETVEYFIKTFSFNLNNKERLQKERSITSEKEQKVKTIITTTDKVFEFKEKTNTSLLLLDNMSELSSGTEVNKGIVVDINKDQFDILEKDIKRVDGRLDSLLESRIATEDQVQTVDKHLKSCIEVYHSLNNDVQQLKINCTTEKEIVQSVILEVAELKSYKVETVKRQLDYAEKNIKTILPVVNDCIDLKLRVDNLEKNQFRRHEWEEIKNFIDATANNFVLLKTQIDPMQTSLEHFENQAKLPSPHIAELGCLNKQFEDFKNQILCLEKEIYREREARSYIHTTEDTLDKLALRLEQLENETKIIDILKLDLGNCKSSVSMIQELVQGCQPLKDATEFHELQSCFSVVINKLKSLPDLKNDLKSVQNQLIGINTKINKFEMDQESLTNLQLKIDMLARIVDSQPQIIDSVKQDLNQKFKNLQQAVEQFVELATFQSRQPTPETRFNLDAQLSAEKLAFSKEIETLNTKLDNLEQHRLLGTTTHSSFMHQVEGALQQMQESINMNNLKIINMKSNDEDISKKELVESIANKFDVLLRKNNLEINNVSSEFKNMLYKVKEQFENELNNQKNIIDNFIKNSNKILNEINKKHEEINQSSISKSCKQKENEKVMEWQLDQDFSENTCGKLHVKNEPLKYDIGSSDIDQSFTSAIPVNYKTEEHQRPFFGKIPEPCLFSGDNNQSPYLWEIKLKQYFRFYKIPESRWLDNTLPRLTGGAEMKYMQLVKYNTEPNTFPDLIAWMQKNFRKKGKDQVLLELNRIAWNEDISSLSHKMTIVSYEHEDITDEDLINSLYKKLPPNWKGKIDAFPEYPKSFPDLINYLSSNIDMRLKLGGGVLLASSGSSGNSSSSRNPKYSMPRKETVDNKKPFLDSEIWKNMSFEERKAYRYGSNINNKSAVSRESASFNKKYVPKTQFKTNMLIESENDNNNLIKTDCEYLNVNEVLSVITDLCQKGGRNCEDEGNSDEKCLFLDFSTNITDTTNMNSIYKNHSKSSIHKTRINL